MVRFCMNLLALNSHFFQRLAHQQAWTLAGIRHGDVSGRNIMTVYKSSDVMYGILIDWDLDHRGRNAKNTNQTVRSHPYMRFLLHSH